MQWKDRDWAEIISQFRQKKRYLLVVLIPNVSLEYNNMKNVDIRGKGVKCLFGKSYESPWGNLNLDNQIMSLVREAEHDFYLKHQ